MNSVEPTGTGRRKSVSSLPGHRRAAHQVADRRAERLVERAGQQAAVGEPGRALVGRGHGEPRVDTWPSPTVERRCSPASASSPQPKHSLKCTPSSVPGAGAFGCGTAGSTGTGGQG